MQISKWVTYRFPECTNFCFCCCTSATFRTIHYPLWVFPCTEWRPLGLITFTEQTRSYYSGNVELLQQLWFLLPFLITRLCSCADGKQKQPRGNRFLAIYLSILHYCSEAHGQVVLKVEIQIQAQVVRVSLKCWSFRYTFQANYNLRSKAEARENWVQRISVLAKTSLGWGKSRTSIVSITCKCHSLVLHKQVSVSAYNFLPSVYVSQPSERKNASSSTWDLLNNI